MVAHGALADDQGLGDLVVGHALGHQLQDGRLTWGEGVLRGRQLGRIAQLADHLERDGGMQAGLAAMHGMDGLEQLLGRGIFEQIAQGAGLDRRKDLVVGGKAGDHQDTGLRVLGNDLGDRLQAGLAGHDDVHQDDVRAQSTGLLDRLHAVLGFADHLHARLAGDQGAQPSAHDGVIVGDQDADRIVHIGLFLSQLLSLSLALLRVSVIPLRGFSYSPNGTLARTLVPSPGSERRVNVPPSRSARSRMV